MSNQPITHDYKVHYSRAEREWSVSTKKGLTHLKRLGTKYYYVNKLPYKFLRDAIMAVLIKDEVV